MKILFICGSIEPGHDGIGDYTRELAGALSDKGIVTHIIALMDRSVEGILRENQSSGQGEISVTRISKSLSSRVRKAEYHKVVQDFQPDWISLQYVPYAFSAKGIPFSFPGLIAVNDPEIKWHFMIHESYIGGNLSLKDKFIQRVQIAVLKLLVKQFNPKVVHTSTPLYKRYLTDINIESEILGLFGNIPLARANRDIRSNEILRGVYFGSAPAEKYYKLIAYSLHSFVKSEKVKMEVILCGNSGEKGKAFANVLRNNVSADSLKVLEKGEMTAIHLSELFLKSDFGIARVAPSLLGKSGSAISMLEHGLPLWVPLSENDNLLRANFDFRIDQCFSNLTDFTKVKSSNAPKSRLEETALNLLESLTGNTSIPA